MFVCVGFVFRENQQKKIFLKRGQKFSSGENKKSVQQGNMLHA
jgi:hypothetical protein